MRSGTCPKCGGTNIKKIKLQSIASDSAVWDYEYYGLFQCAFMTRYVC